MEASSHLVNAATDLRNDIVDTADFPVEIDERLDLLSSWYLDHIRPHARGTHVHGFRLVFRRAETERRSDFDDGRHHLCQA